MKDPKQIINIDDIEVEVRFCRRSRYIKLRAASKIELVIPANVSLQRAQEFLFSKKLWVKTQYLKLKAKQPEEYKKICIFGDEYQIITQNNEINEPIKLAENILYISKVIPEEKIALTIRIWLKKIFKSKIQALVKNYADQLGVHYTKLVVKDTKSRWGSCSSSGTISLSWRLILAPKPVLDYVIIHELCHLKEMNHSAKFWLLVRNMMPNYIEPRSWLKQNGKFLHHW